MPNAAWSGCVCNNPVVCCLPWQEGLPHRCSHDPYNRAPRRAALARWDVASYPGTTAVEDDQCLRQADGAGRGSDDGYWVIGLAPVAVAIRPRKCGRALSRQPALTPAEEAAVRRRLQALGFNFVRVQQIRAQAHAETQRARCAFPGTGRHHDGGNILYKQPAIQLPLPTLSPCPPCAASALFFLLASPCRSGVPTRSIGRRAAVRPDPVGRLHSMPSFPAAAGRRPV